MTTISSRHHPIVKHFRDVARGGGSSMLLDGWHLLAEATDAGVPIETLAVYGPRSDAEEALIARARRASAHVVEVSDAVLNAISPVNSPTGVVAVAVRPRIDAASILVPTPALVLAAIGVQDPGNLGALVRAAAAAGATGVIVDGTTADPWGWKALRASMGGVFRIPVIRTLALEASIAEWHAAGIVVAAAVPRGGISMYEMALTPPAAIIVGGEGGGVPEAIVAAATTRVSIPMHGAVESLNVATAAALILYEARRQRTS
jgi:TrmH family RNA methyltransferase